MLGAKEYMVETKQRRNDKKSFSGAFPGMDFFVIPGIQTKRKHLRQKMLTARQLFCICSKTLCYLTKNKGEIMNNIDNAMQQLMQQKHEEEEALAYGAHLETLKKPITFRVEEMYIFFSDLLCNEFKITKGEFNRMMYENAILDAIDALGEDWTDYQKKFFEFKISQKETK